MPLLEALYEREIREFLGGDIGQVIPANEQKVFERHRSWTEGKTMYVRYILLRMKLQNEIWTSTLN